MARFNLPHKHVRVLNMAMLEIKSYTAAYREVLCFWFIGLLTGGVLWLGVGVITERGSLFEPFTVGVVDNDGAPELIFIFDYFNEHVIDLEFMEKSEALRAMDNGEIPAFIELPLDFTADVFRGVNSPFTVHLNSAMPLQSSLVMLLASGGIEFLSASQAGVYAALFYAYDSGLDWPRIQRDLLIPVNMAFASELILHDEMFTRVELPLVAGNTEDFFITRFAAFWHMLGLLALIKFLRRYPDGIIMRFKMAGVSPAAMIFIKFSGLAAAVTVISLPVIPIIGFAGAMLLNLFMSLFGLLCGKVFDGNGTASGLLIFATAFISYFASGGIVPFLFLPQSVLFMRYFSIIYWAVTL